MSESVLTATVELTDGMAFQADTGSGHSLAMDAAVDVGGVECGPRPMEMLLVGLGGCTGMDVISILRKMRQDVTSYEVRVFNQGSAPSPNVRLVVTLPEGLVPIRGEGPAANRVQGQQVLFEPLASMAPRADAIYRIRARATRPGDYRFRAELLSDQLARPVVAEENTHAYSDGIAPAVRR